MLKFKTSCAVLAYLSSNLLNEVGLFLFRYFEVGLRVWEIVVKKFTFAISSPDEFLFYLSVFGSSRSPCGAVVNMLPISLHEFFIVTCTFARFHTFIVNNYLHTLVAK